MISNVFSNVFGTRNERLVRSMSKLVDKINALEPDFQALSDEQLRGKTEEFKKRLAEGVPLNSLLPEAFAAVREASVRTLGMRHFDVQLIGGMVLNDGKIAEMRTGEGKTLVATLPAYLNALTGGGVHIVTVNDYLAKRDAEWMQPIYEFLGMTVGINLTGIEFDDKQAAYEADITYGTNNEFGFDYLRDNMVMRKIGLVQRDQYFAIVDEVDCILIDEARTPLIISGPAEGGPDMYIKVNELVQKLTKQEKEGEPGDYSVDEKGRQVHLTEAGHEAAEKLFEDAGLIEKDTSLYDYANIGLMHYLNAALRSQALFKRDVDYIVKDGKVIIVDEHTGRLMDGRRWSDGLHQATEAKEGVDIQSENQTLASISFQNYFRLYDKLSGMTGTADTEAFEFHQIYGLEVVVMPTNKPIVRDDKSDLVYLTAKGKYNAIVEDIKKRHNDGQPVLVGTTSIDSSEHLSNMLKQAKIRHQVLNAKYHESEAVIVSEAGRPGAVTIATNMAGRGTDIVLGGSLKTEIAELKNPTEKDIEDLRQDWSQRHQQVISAGGLHVLGAERNESRRIDNQLRGRSGRQGDPGSSQYYLSLEDNLMRIFASDRMSALMSRLGMEEDVPIEARMVSRSIASAQRKVEAHNFDIRKNLLKFDDVANDQRKVVYAQRRELLDTDDISENIQVIFDNVLHNVIEEHMPLSSLEEQWDIPGLEETLTHEFNVSLPINYWLDKEESLHDEVLRERILAEARKVYEQKEETFTSEVMRQLEKTIMLRNLDVHWKEHLAAMDHLRQGIGLRGYAQKNPVQEYKREAFEMFSNMLEGLKRDVVSSLMTVEIREEDPAAQMAPPPQANPFSDSSFKMQHVSMGQAIDPEEMAAANQEEEGDTAVASATFVREDRKVGRNEPCPCGSGKKFKACHGKLST